MTYLDDKLNKRWGKEFIDQRLWPVYNEQLVKRGEYLLDLDWVKNWDKELKKMNSDKIGRPYIYPNSLIKLQGVWHAKNIPYRMIEGITRKLVAISQLPVYNDYTTVNRRVNKLDIHLDLPDDTVMILGGDGSGFQAISGGEYLREKYGKKNRRWVQVIILGDPLKKEPVSFEVNIIPRSEPISIEKQLTELQRAGIQVREFLGDGGFDKMDLWKYLENNRIRPVIKPDKNARDDSVSTWRNINVKHINEVGYADWARRVSYGRRWLATEGIFSAIKRIFGEQLAGKTEIGLIQEAKMKIWSYVAMKRYGEA